MLRRLHKPPPLLAGSIALDRQQAHHVRDVLRLGVGDAVELFDDTGATAPGVIEHCDATGVTVRVERVEVSPQTTSITLAAAVPKGDRADWMIEKLSELGVNRFIPLSAARSVVLPAGRNKHQRWQRLATESAKQSRRVGVMQIDELTTLPHLLTRAASAGELPSGGLSCYLSTAGDSASLLDVLESVMSDFPSRIMLLIGPEGGWTVEEMESMRAARLTAARLTATILRVETAAVTAAALVAVCGARKAESRDARVPGHEDGNAPGVT